jgi:DNA modification methylase
LSKSKQYYYDAEAIKEPSVNGNRTRNKRSVWTIPTKPLKGDDHFAVFPPELPETCLLAGSPEAGVVLDPFSGAATTGIAAVRHGRSYVGIELNPEYVELSQRRFERELGLEIDAKHFKAPEQLYVACTVEASQCAIALSSARFIDLDSERYEEFRERMLALAATELAA